MSKAAVYYSFLECIKTTSLLVVNNTESANELLAIARVAFPKLRISYIPEYETTPYSLVPSTSDNVAKRFEAIKSIGDTSLVILTVPALARKYFNHHHYQSTLLELAKGQNFSFNELTSKLQNMGYSRMMSAIAAGEYAVRGSLIDIAVSNSLGIRIDFFGSEIEKIREFDLASQKSTATIDSITIAPVCEFPRGEQSMLQFKENFINNFGVAHSTFLEGIVSGNSISGMEWLQPLFADCKHSILSFFKTKPTIYKEEFTASEADKFFKQVTDNYKKREQDAKIPILSPDQIWAQEQDIEKLLNDAATLPACKYDTADNLAQVAQLTKTSVFDLLKDLIKNSKTPIYLGCTSSFARRKMERLCTDHEIVFSFVASIENSHKPGMLYLTEAGIAKGFRTKQFAILSESDIFGHKLSKSSNSKQSSNASVFTEFNAMVVGDLVVHLEHGIGKFDGLETITVLGAPHDFVRIIYADDAKFYLPVENIDQITKHGSHDGSLDKLGAASWQRRKGKIKERIKLAAEQLLKTAAIRDVTSSNPIEYDTELYEEFCNRFPYAETDDQLRAINDIMNDLLANKPMDRLVCGDVGFGKTEVAMRAVFLVLASIPKKQVAVLVPTTLLSRQHFKNFCERFEGFGLKIAQLSKFTPRSELSKVKKGIKEGSVDIVIGTHALLSKDISFHNLGLIVVDEEQHFGVRQKERLKELKKNCHILTLSATPIPRTLQMSLSGIKSLSIIASPPQDRLPVKTSVLPFDELTLREAILREIYRGGRVFIVTPRIAYMESLRDFMKKSLPDISFAAANGALEATELDNIMNKFYDGEYHVLIATNIVESGLDIPMANTVIIDHAHYFGLSQLYQIRGRVGRGAVQAYAYLTYPARSYLTALAQKRLEILSSLDSLGAGFSIASHDMDLRGYGNLVGEEQSGHIREIGFELYQQMLEEAIANLQSGDELDEDDFITTINLGVAVQIPESYIPDSSLRLSIFRKLAAATSEEGLIDITAELEDRFGKVPLSTQNLIEVLRIKILAKRVFISKIDYGSKGLIIAFKKVSDTIQQKILGLAIKHPELKIRPDNKIIIERNWATAEKKLRGTLEVITELSDNA